jgi:hypothetical protein
MIAMISALFVVSSFLLVVLLQSKRAEKGGFLFVRGSLWAVGAIAISLAIANGALATAFMPEANPVAVGVSALFGCLAAVLGSRVVLVPDGGELILFDGEAQCTGNRGPGWTFLNFRTRWALAHSGSWIPAKVTAASEVGFCNLSAEVTVLLPVPLEFTAALDETMPVVNYSWNDEAAQALREVDPRSSSSERQEQFLNSLRRRLPTGWPFKFGECVIRCS